MNYRQLLRLITTVPRSKSILIRGHLGIGKSALVKQAASILSKKLGEPVPLVDIRLSQQDVGDLRGIPYMVGGNTFFAPPLWYPIDPSYRSKQSEFLKKSGHEYIPWQTHKHGIIFLDELNRATREVLQCSFELTLDHRLGGVPIPEGWLVIAAVNHDSRVYEINKLDPAHINRFLVVDFAPTTKEWLDYAEHRTALGQMHPSVLAYLSANPSRLDPSEQDLVAASRDGSQVATRRSWTTLAEVLVESGVTLANDEYSALLVQSCIGTLHMASFLSFSLSRKASLHPTQVLDKWSDATMSYIEDLVAGGKGHELSYLSKAVLDLLGTRPSNLVDSCVWNLHEFMQALPDELATDFYRGWKKQNNDQASMVYCAADRSGTRYPVKEKLLAAMSVS